jgi:hypothetical protein
VLAGYYYGQGWGNTQPWSRLSPLLVLLLVAASSS